jgi:hypothetical protein
VAVWLYLGFVPLAESTSPLHMAVIPIVHQCPKSLKPGKGGMSSPPVLWQNCMLSLLCQARSTWTKAVVGQCGPGFSAQNSGEGGARHLTLAFPKCRWHTGDFHLKECVSGCTGTRHSHMASYLGLRGTGWISSRVERWEELG